MNASTADPATAAACGRACALVGATGTIMGVKEIGIPAAHIRAQQKSLRRDVARHAVFGTALALTALWVAAQLPGKLGVASAAVGAVAALIEAQRVSRAETQYQKLRAGRRAEEETAAAVRRSHAAVVVHGAVLAGKGDCDHLVIGPYAAAIETKHGRGALAVVGGKLVAGGRTMPRDPIGQALRQARTASKILGVAVQAIVCVPQSTSPVQRVGDVYLCSARDLPLLLAQLPSVVPNGRAEELAARLNR